MIPYKDIGDSLTISEFNGIISILRNNIKFNENIKINTSTVKGDFGSYTFNFNEATIVDDGVLITNETLSSIGTVKLINPTFPNSRYYLDLKVYSIDNINIDDNNYLESGETVTQLTIPLERDVEANIPFETLDMNNIISFDAKIRIDHNDLVIKGSDYLSTSINVNLVEWGDDFVLTAVYLDENQLPVENQPIGFYNGNTLIDTINTNADGVAELTHHFNDIGDHTLYSMSGALKSEEITLTVEKRTPKLILSSDKAIAYIDGDFSITGVLNDDKGILNNIPIKLYNNEVLISGDSLVTDNNGYFNKTFAVTEEKDNNFKAVFEGNNRYKAVTSNIVNVYESKIPTRITIKGQGRDVYYSQSSWVGFDIYDSVSGNLIKESITLKLYLNSQYHDSVGSTLGTNWRAITGVFAGNYQAKWVFEGNNKYKPSQSGGLMFYISKAPTYVNIAEASEYKAGDTISIEVGTDYYYSSFYVPSVDITYGGQTSTVYGSDSSFSYTIPSLIASDNILKVKFNGDSNYSSSEATINVTAPYLSTITMSTSSSGITVNYKDNNGANLANIDISGTEIQFYGDVTMSLTLDNQSTDSNGNWVLPRGSMVVGRGTVKATFNGITSNIANYNW